jgi:N-acetylglutamate synthase-like GNAT family acetyltransferase
MTLIRRPVAEEMDTIFMGGFDAWAGSLNQTEYLVKCRRSEKYRQGRWWVLDCGGRIVSSLIVYRNCFGLENGFSGIGTVTTQPDRRCQGFASELLRQVLQVEQPEALKGFFLFSEVKPDFYERHGFVRLSDKLQKHAGSVCMVKCSAVDLRDIESGEVPPPDYF